MAKANSKRILIALDFEEQSLAALHQGIGVAVETGADMILLHVLEECSGVEKFLTKEQVALIHKDVETRMKKEITRIQALHKTLKVVPLILSGKVYDRINEVAVEQMPLLILMGCNGSGEGKRRFIGSNTLHVIRSSRFPVLTIKKKPVHQGFKNIVLPLDLTKETREKVLHAMELAKLYGAAVRVISVIFTKDEFIVNKLTRQLSQVKAQIEKSGVECSAEIVKGIKEEESLPQCMVEYAEKVEGDLLLIMTQQEMDTTDCFVGSAAQETLLKTELPVLTVIPELAQSNNKGKPRKK